MKCVILNSKLLPKGILFWKSCYDLFATEKSRRFSWQKPTTHLYSFFAIYLSEELPALLTGARCGCVMILSVFRNIFQSLWPFFAVCSLTIFCQFTSCLPALQKGKTIPLSFRFILQPASSVLFWPSFLWLCLPKL